MAIWISLLAKSKEKHMEENNLELLKFIIFAILTIGSTYLAFKADDYRDKKRRDSNTSS